VHVCYQHCVTVHVCYVHCVEHLVQLKSHTSKLVLFVQHSAIKLLVTGVPDFALHGDALCDHFILLFRTHHDFHWFALFKTLRGSDCHSQPIVRQVPVFPYEGS